MKIFLCLTLLISFVFAGVDINSATPRELLELDGIGKAKAQKIIDYRELNGCFSSIDELARIEGISKKLVAKNRAQLSLGVCEQSVNRSSLSASSFKDVLLNPINVIFVVIIFVLAFLDQKTKKDFKSQIVSVGVLGTFVGIFIGLQSFDPEDIMNSVNQILAGLKTAFFTSIVGMSVATVLSIFQKLKE